MAKVSKGIHNTVNKKRKVKPTAAEKVANKWAAYIAGKNVWFTIDNPNPNETAKRKIRVRGRDLYGDPRKYTAKFFV